MAGGYACNFCEGARPVVWLITNLTNGATFSVCEDDAPVAMIPLLAGMLGADGPQLYAAIEREINRQSKAAAKEAAEATAAAEADSRAADGDEVTPQSGDGAGGETERKSPAGRRAARQGRP